MRVIPVLIAAVLALGGCAADGGTGGAARTSGDPASAAPTTDFPADAQLYAQAAIGSWTAATDPAQLGQYASDQAVSQLGRIAAGPPVPDMTWTFAAKSVSPGRATCLFRNANGDDLTVSLQDPTSGPQQVTAVAYTPTTYPGTVAAYAAELLAAWRDGNQPRMAALAGPNVAAYLAGMKAPAAVPTLQASTAPGKVSVHATGDQVDLIVVVVPAGLGKPHAVKDIVDVAASTTTTS
jgi:hypothetical protein